MGRCGLAGPLAPWARGMPRAGWAGRPTPVLPCAQDSAHEQGAIESPRVRALCLRSTASQAPERTAASGWAGLGVYGVSCQPTPPRQTTDNPEPLWLWLWLRLLLWLTAGAGRSPADPPSLRTKTFPLFSANRHPFATPVPYCAAACAHGRPMLKIARPSLRSIQDDVAMAGSWGSSNRTYQATCAVLLPLHGDSDKVTSN